MLLMLHAENRNGEHHCVTFVGYTPQLIRTRSAPAPHDGADHSRVKQSEIDHLFVSLVPRRG